MTSNELSDFAFFLVSMSDMDPRPLFKDCEDSDDTVLDDIETMREAGRAINTAKAKMVRNYFNALIAQGFTCAEALVIAANFKPDINMG